MTTVRSVESFPIGSVKGYELPVEIHGLPFPPEELTRLLESCPAVIALPADEGHDHLPLEYANQPRDNELSPYELRQPSEHHGRSFQLVGQAFEQPWQDEYGNTYTALTLKGNNYSKPSIIKSPTATDGYIPYGLQESTVIERVIKASDVLRRRGISTEYVLGLAEPKLLPWPLTNEGIEACEYVSLAEYKRRIISTYWQELDETEREELTFTELFAKFQDTTFYTSLRATDTPYRLFDLHDDVIRQRVYDAVNTTVEQPFTSDNSKDEERFLCEIAMPNLGRNLARLHIDLAHRFPHLGNITAFGGIVDLDSVHGASLGLEDAPITMRDRVYDLYYLLEQIPLKHAGLPVQIGSQLSAHNRFMSSYLAETYEVFGGGEAAIEHIGQLLATFVSYVADRADRDDGRGRLVLHAMKRIYQKDMLGIDAEDCASIDQLRQAMLEHVKHNWEGLKAIGVQHLIAELPTMCDDTINDHINEIVDAHQAGEQYDLLGQPEVQKYLTRIWSAHLADLLIEKLGQSLAEAPTGLANIHSVKDVATRAMLYSDLLQQFGEKICEIGEPIVTAMLSEKTEQVKDALHYTFPDKLLGDDTAYSTHTGFSDKQFWYFNDEVPWQHIDTLIQSGSIPITFEQIVFTKQNEPMIKPSSPDVTLVEVATDDTVQGFCLDHTSESQPFITPSFSQKPSYVAIVEASKQTGDKSLRVLIDYRDSAPAQLRLF